MTGLTREEFQVLYALSQTGESLDETGIAAATPLDQTSARAALASCEARGLAEAGRITAAGVAALEPHRVQNAVILAAGLSSRLVPLSYEKPKGVMRVRGEVLIERQIRQLLAAGISDITVVVGYQSEYFDYLEPTFGVRLLHNDQYAEKNNAWSLWLARAELGNTYVCSSDNWFAENPFERYAWKAFYSSQYVEGPTSEWCLEVNGDDRITRIDTAGGRDAWTMLGHAYFDRGFSERFTRILEREHDLPQTDGKLWEKLLAEHLDELSMGIRRWPAGMIYEFDSLRDLQRLDPNYLETVSSEAVDNIVGILGCERAAIHDAYPLSQGLTNLSCHFSVGDKEYVYRHPGVGTEQLVDRHAETAALKLAARLGLDGTFIYEDPDRGWKLSRFVPDCRPLDPHDPTDLARAMRMARDLHEGDARVERSFDFYEEGQGYLRAFLETDAPVPADLDDAAARFERLEAHVKADHAPTCLCHNDFFFLNFLIDREDRCSLIDWEYAGMSDYANDFGTFCVCCQLDEDEVTRALELYFGRTPTMAERRHNLAHIALAGWCWYLWSLLKEAQGDNVGEWLEIYRDYGMDYLTFALDLYEGETLE